MATDINPSPLRDSQFLCSFLTFSFLVRLVRLQYFSNPFVVVVVAVLDLTKVKLFVYTFTSPPGPCTISVRAVLKWFGVQ